MRLNKLVLAILPIPLVYANITFADETIIVSASKDDESDSFKKVEMLKGGTNANIFSKETSIQGNNTRNEAGSLDVGVRGLQGEGRTPIYVDGSLQSTHTNRGYQGTSDRTYIDTDLLSGMKIKKGFSGKEPTTGAIGGRIDLKTLSVDDILKNGQNTGLLIKLKTSNKNTSPTLPEGGGSNTRPLSTSSSPLNFRNGSGTIAWAYRNDIFDAVVAFSKRKNGNYYSGKRGFSYYGTEEKIASQETNVFKNEEVVNTALESESLLLKTNLYLTNEQKLELIYRNHQQKAGEILAAKYFKNPINNGMIQWPLGTANVNAYSSKYSYIPANNNLIKLDAGLWYTTVNLNQLNGMWRSANGGSDVEEWRNLYNNKRIGYFIKNTSELDSLPIVFDYGLNVTNESITPTDDIANFPFGGFTSRHGSRQEESAFFNTTIDIEPLTISFALNSHKAKTKDKSSYNELKYSPKTDLSGEVKYHLNDELSIFYRLSQAYRMPSLYESTVSSEVFSYDPRHPLKPEKAIQNEIGLEFKGKNLAFNDDSINVSASYFDNRTKNYISPGTIDLPSKFGWGDTYTFTNYDALKTAGIDISVKYDSNMFYSEVSSTMYTKRQVCSKEQSSMINQSECNGIGFAWGLTPSRMPPKYNISATIGKLFLNDKLDVGIQYQYFSKKGNPQEWMKGTAASPITSVKATSVVNMYSSYAITPSIEVYGTINNLTNEYYTQPGSVILVPEPGRTITMGVNAKF